MDLPALKKEYAVELKESFFRRAIACAIDSAIISGVTFFLGGFIVAGILSANPAGIFFGVIGDLFMKFDNAGLKTTPLLVAMFGFAIVFGIMSTLYYGILESGSRRTLGKLLMHLEITGFARDVNFMTAIMRNLTKILSGMLGGYLMGIVGVNLFQAVALIVDYRSSPGSKADIRQRYSESSLGTIVLTENDGIEIGVLSVDGAPTVEDMIKGNIEKRKRTAEAKADKPVKKISFAQRPKADPGVSSENGPEEKPAFGRSMAGPLAVDKAEKPPTAREPAPITAPVPFIPPGSVQDATISGMKKDDSRDRSVLTMMIDFDIDEDRAQGLYDAGYRGKEDLADAIPQDLMSINGINPTIAKRVLARADRSVP